jgi:hypothetical protein
VLNITLENVIKEGAPTGPLLVIRESHWKKFPDVDLLVRVLLQ